MKLYAKVGSERAEKGQGGSQLSITLTCGSVERREILLLQLASVEGGKTGYDWRIATLHGDMVFLRSLRAEINKAEYEYMQKGKRQKGEIRCKHGVILQFDDCLNCDKGQ